MKNGTSFNVVVAVAMTDDSEHTARPASASSPATTVVAPTRDLLIPVARAGRSADPTSLDFASAIAGRRNEIRLHSGGNEYRTTSRWPRKEPLQPWLTYLQDSNGAYASLAFDFDTSKGAADRDCHRFSALLVSVGIGHVIVRSGPSDGRNVLATFHPHVPLQLVIAIGELAARCFPSLDRAPLAGSSHAAIRPPLSVHRNGGRSEVLMDPAEALCVLKERNDPKLLLALLEQLGGEPWRFEHLLAPLPNDQALADRLSAEGWDLIRTGSKRDGDTSPSGVRWSALLHLINANFDLGAAVRILTNPRYGVASKFQQGARKHRSSVVEYLHLEWSRAKPWVDAHPAISSPTEARAAVIEVSEAAARVQWCGRTGATDHAVLEACVELGLKAGRLEFTASTRQLGELAKMSRKRVGNALERLDRKQWLTLGLRGRGVQGTVIRLSIPPTTPTTTLHTGGRVFNGAGSGMVVRGTLHDAFRWGALSRATGEVLAALDLCEGQTAKELQAATGSCLSSVYKALKRLSGLGWAQRFDDGTWQRLVDLDGMDLDGVAERFGTAGHTELQQARRAREREQYLKIAGSHYEEVNVETGRVSTVFVLGAGWKKHSG